MEGTQHDQDMGWTWQPAAPLFAVLVLGRLTTALTWGWSAVTKPPWAGYGWFEDAVVVSKHYAWVPGWAGVADWMLANLGWVAPLVVLWELYLFVTLFAGFMTRLNGWLAAGWAGLLVVLSVSIPKSGEHIPVDFPVPIGGWFWLLGPIVIFPLVAAARAGRLWGVDAVLRGRWLDAGGWRRRLAHWM